MKFNPFKKKVVEVKSVPSFNLGWVLPTLLIALLFAGINTPTVKRDSLTLDVIKGQDKVIVLTKEQEEFRNKNPQCKIYETNEYLSLKSEICNQYPAEKVESIDPITGKKTITLKQ